MKKYKNFIDGKWGEARSKRTFEKRNPANRDEVLGIFPRSDSKDIDAAVEAARRAYNSWRLVPAPKRGEILLKTAKIIERRKEEIARLLTLENGKILKEARGDTQEGIDMANLIAGEGRKLFGQTANSELPNKLCMSLRQPIGVCGIITPWNFPVAIPSWKIFPALLCGNTVVFKPASDAPICGTILVEILVEAGLPSGVLNLVHGTGEEVGTPLVKHKDVDLISFTGSSEVGRQIASICGAELKKVALELGGKNAQIVMEDADMDLALEGALWGSFATAGQRCTATSRLILQKNIAKEFTERFVEKAKGIKIGNGLDPKTQMGPIINERQLRKTESYVKMGKEEGAKLLLGGKVYRKGECENGYFFEPTVFGNVTTNMRIAQDEIFGPVVCILAAKNLDDAIGILNNTPYGLSSSIYTRDINKAYRAMRDIECGITYVNGPTIGSEVQMPFGGVKDSGNGHREAGVQVLDIFSEWKTIYVDYSGKLQKAQIDTYKK